MKIQKLFLVLCVAVFTTGCTTFKPTMPTMSSLFKGKDASGQTDANEEEEISFGEPQKMLAIWKDSVRQEPGTPSMRGFGGRIFLYDASGQPIRAEGELVVYGFDDSVKEREGSKADKKVVFQNHTFQQRYSKSGLGDSYSVWIDWDKVGSQDKSVTLIPFFRTPDGRIVKAGQSIYSLHTPGKNKLYKEKLASHEDSSESEMNKVSHANYVEGPNASNNVRTVGAVEDVSMKPKNSMKTTTIQLPSTTQRRVNRVNNLTAKADDDSMDVVPDTSEATPKVRKYPSRIDAARKKRLEEIGKGNVFGVPGQL